ncbi:MAG TPA: hypothetical protein VJ941_04045 [Gracilimonas sp.]|nr:hypothetical protein [Gracilimonas sp.]
MRSSLFTLIGSIILLSFISACGLFNNDIQVEKRLSLNFQAENLGDSLSTEQDSLVITDFKFSVDRFIIAGNDIELESSPNVSTFLFTYDLDAAQERLVLEVGLGIADNSTFDSYTMYLQPVPNNAGILDDDFYGEDDNYSVVIKGKYNLKNFTFRISPTFEKIFSFDPVSLNDIDETLIIRKSIDLNEIFLNPDGSILDPTDSANESIIRERINANLQVEGFAVNIY